MEISKVVNCREKIYDVYIGRPSIFGNPFVIGKDGTREDVIKKYRDYIMKNEKLLRDLPELKNKTLGCYCVEKPIDFIRSNKRCHGEILLELIGRKI